MTVRIVAVARVTVSGVVVLAVARSMALIVDAILSRTSAGVAFV